MTKLKRESHDHYIPPLTNQISPHFVYRHETTPNPNEKKILEAIERIGNIFGISDEAKKLVDAAPIEAIPIELPQKRPDTHQDGIRLTAEGRLQVRKGIRKCTNMDTVFLGKDSDRPICSYEIVWLVRRLHKLEKRLNADTTIVNQYSSLLLSLHKIIPFIVPPPSTSQPNYEIRLRFLGSKRLWTKAFVFSFLFFIVWKTIMWTCFG